MNNYVAGTLVRLSAVLKTSASNALTDATMVCKVLLPDGTSSTVTSVRDSAGNYHADYLASVVGLHRYEWIASGAATAAARGQFLVTQVTF